MPCTVWRNFVWYDMQILLLWFSFSISFYEDGTKMKMNSEILSAFNVGLLLVFKLISNRLISCSAHVNNQSWILNLPLFFSKQLQIVGFFGKKSKQSYYDVYLKLLRHRKNKKVIKNGRFWTQDCLLTCWHLFDNKTEQDTKTKGKNLKIYCVLLLNKTNKLPLTVQVSGIIT